MVPRHFAETCEIRRNSSRACTLEMCTSTTGAGTAAMRIAARVEDDAVGLEALALQGVHDLALEVALVVDDVDVRMPGFQLGQEAVEAPVAIDAGLPLPEQVEVGSVDDRDTHVEIDVPKCKGFAKTGLGLTKAGPA
jgi:hypothetical protein